MVGVVREPISFGLFNRASFGIETARAPFPLQRNRGCVTSRGDGRHRFHSLEHVIVNGSALLHFVVFAALQYRAHRYDRFRSYSRVLLEVVAEGLTEQL